ncbi:MAG: hypothetical protein AB7G35_06530 [Hyphomicrobiaceae bacterium]
MADTILLAKVLGIFLIVIGAVILLRRRYFLPVFATYPEQRLTRTITSLAELLAGLFLIIAHNRWSPFAAAVITIIGWLAVLEAAIYLLLSDAAVSRFITKFNREEWYIGGGLVSLAIGVYLAAFGFGWT